MLRYTNGTYALAQSPPNTAHEFEYGFLDQYGLNDRYVVLTRRDWQVSQTKSGLMQTGSYALLNQFRNTIKFVHHKNLLRNMLPLGHVLTSSCLHGTLQYEYLHVGAAHFQGLLPQGRYAQLKALFYVLSRYANAPLTTLHAGQFPSNCHRAVLLLATFVHAAYHL